MNYELLTTAAMIVPCFLILRALGLFIITTSMNTDLDDEKDRAFLGWFALFLDVICIILAAYCILDWRS